MIEGLEKSVAEQGELVRGMKGKASKEEITAAVEELKARKAQLTAALEEAMAKAGPGEEYDRLKAKLPAAPKPTKADEKKAKADKKKGGEASKGVQLAL